MKYSMEKMVLVMLIFTVTLFHACQDTPGDADSTKDTADGVAKGDTSVSDTREKDAAFLQDQVGGNYAEIKFAQLAKDKSGNKEIKDVADMLIQDHTAALNQLKDAASRKGVTVPAEENQDAKDQYKELSEKKPADFDKAWCDALMDKHKKTIDKLEDVSDDKLDAELKTWAAAILPKIRTHHEKLMACHDKLK